MALLAGRMHYNVYLMSITWFRILDLLNASMYNKKLLRAVILVVFVVCGMLVVRD